VVSKLGSNPFVRRQQSESEAGEVAKKAPLGKALRQQPEAAPARGRSVLGADHFERATGGLFATAFARPAQGPLHEPATPGTVGSGPVDVQTEPFDSAALTAEALSSELHSLAEQLEQLTAEKQQLKKAMVEVMEQIEKLESSAPGDPRLDELMSLLEQLRDRLAAVDQKIADVSNRIEQMGDAQEAVKARQSVAQDRRGEAAPADKERVASARHSEGVVSAGDKDP
jgi:hypothetical protein